MSRAAVVTGGGTGSDDASYVNGAVISVDGGPTIVGVGTPAFGSSA